MDNVQELRRRADGGDQDAVDQLVELAGEAGDMDELRRLAEAGSSDAVDVLVELAGEREDFDELRRLAELGVGPSVTADGRLMDRRCVAALRRSGSDDVDPQPEPVLWTPAGE